MTAIAATLYPVANGDCQQVTWLAIPNANEGYALEMPASADRSVQIDGTFGAGGSVSIQGSNDGATFYTLNDAQGAALTFTSAGLKQIVEVTRYIKPVVTAGDGTTALNVSMLIRNVKTARGG